MIRGILSAMFVAAFGLFLIWIGLSGNIPVGPNGKRLIPKWLYILGGISVLILPVAYVIILLQI